MAEGVLQCCDQPEDPCEDLRNRIRRRVFQRKDETGTRGLRERIMDQIYGRNGPGTPEWDGHDTAITNLKREIAKLMKDFSDNNCGDKAPIGRDAMAWINRPNPAPSEWKGPQQMEANQRSIWDWEYWEEVTGLTGVALVLYLIVSEGSRIYPPRNLVPVP